MLSIWRGDVVVEHSFCTFDSHDLCWIVTWTRMNHSHLRVVTWVQICCSIFVATAVVIFVEFNPKRSRQSANTERITWLTDITRIGIGKAKSNAIATASVFAKIKPTRKRETLRHIDFCF